VLKGNHIFAFDSIGLLNDKEDDGVDEEEEKKNMYNSNNLWDIIR
jgi:hypothetical protein